MPPKASNAQQLEADMKDRLASIMNENKLITVDDAMKRVQVELLKNNPFVPPTGTICPINDLPNELLAHIFYIGTHDQENEEDDEEEDEDDDDDAFDLKDGWETESEGASESGQPPDEIIDVDATDGDVAMGSASSTNGSKSSCSSWDSESEVRLPFQVLVSHVCKRWRQVSLSTPTLWTYITFSEPPFESARVWIERSGTAPISIEVDCTRRRFQEFPEHDGMDLEMQAEDDIIAVGDNDGIQILDGGNNVPAIETESISVVNGTVIVDAAVEDVTGTDSSSDEDPPPYFSPEDIATILDIICPHVSRWKSFAAEVNEYQDMHAILSRLSSLPSAPLLEDLQLHHYEEEDLEASAEFAFPALRLPFFSPFQGHVPKLKNVALWGVHLAWDEDLVDKSLPGTSVLLKSATELSDLELAYHASDVRPSFDAFRVLLTASRRLDTLGLVGSGPAGGPSDWVPPESPALPSITLPSLRRLSLYYHHPEYATGLLRVLDVPNLKCLRLDLDGEDYFEFVQELCGSNKSFIGNMPPRRRQGSILNGLEEFKIAELSSSQRIVEMVLSHLGCLKVLDINCSTDANEFFERLMKPVVSSSTTSMSGTQASTMYCPSLVKLRTFGVEGCKMREMVEARRAAGVPLKQVLISRADRVSHKEEEWFQKNLELGMEYYDASEEEESDEEIFLDEDGIDFDIEGLDDDSDYP